MPKLAVEAAPLTMEAAREAMVITFVHWGVHAWAIYGIVGFVAGSISGFRYNLPLTIRSGLLSAVQEPDQRAWIGDAVDTSRSACTLFGIATSLGFGCSRSTKFRSRITCSVCRTSYGSKIPLIVGDQR